MVDHLTNVEKEGNMSLSKTAALCLGGFSGGVATNFFYPFLSVTEPVKEGSASLLLVPLVFFSAIAVLLTLYGSMKKQPTPTA